jgi:thymidylate kinase
VGADGAGKSTIAHRLAAALPLPVRYLYMGDNPASANRTLPTKRLLRWLRRRPVTKLPGSTSRTPAAPAAPTGASLSGALKGGLRLGHRLAEEWFRQVTAWSYQWRGYVVLFDRHFFADYFAHDLAPTGPRQLSSRIHGFVLRHLYPRPDLVICLDAPAEILYARKPEGTLEARRRRREEYFAIRPFVQQFAVIDVTQPEDAVVREATALITAFWEARRRG